MPSAGFEPANLSVLDRTATEIGWFSFTAAHFFEAITPALSEAK
jgi:hypothetical protein